MTHLQNFSLRAPHWDAAQLDNEYNNRLRVPDFLTRHVLPWQALSAQVRQEQACLLDIAYGDAPSETLDIFPGNGAQQSVLVFIHGGYWRSLDKADHSFVAPAFTRQGVCVVVPNYALCGANSAVTVEDITMQMVRCLVWVYQNIGLYGGDRRRITVAGHSAGGHLAAMMVACLWKAVNAKLPTKLVKNAMSISGLHDLAPIMQSPYLQTDLKLTPSQVQRCSPAYFGKPPVPLLAVCGGDESSEFIRQNALIQTAWGERSVPVCEALPGRNHFSILEAFCTPADRAHALVKTLLE